MPLKQQWIDELQDGSQIERLADIRLRCYGTKPSERESMLERTRADRIDSGDALILSDETGDVATATSMSLQANVRGTVVPCQGVAWVGTGKSHRRRKIDGRGLASHVMHALLAKARERKQVFSLLAPFRVSFYEHFGYGVIERQNVWSLPLGILPQDDVGNFAEAGANDFDAMLASRERQFLQTHGDVRTDARSLHYWVNSLADSGFRMIDWQGDRVTSQFNLGTEIEGQSAVAVVHRPYWNSLDALRRLLAMLGTLKDQYSVARITLPSDLPVAWWFKERQQPHRRIDHPAAVCTTITRMQGRVLDHVAFLNATKLPTTARGTLAVTINECDGPEVTVRIDVTDGQVEAKLTTGPADVTMPDVTWAAIAFGDQLASVLAAMKLIDVKTPSALTLLDAFAAGPVPYCLEYF